MQQTIHNSGTDDPYRRALLNQEEIEYFRAMGNNVTIFLHGFAIEYGKFDEAFIISDESDGQATILGMANEVYATIYRNVSENIPREYAKNNTDVLFQHVNGTGSFNWAIHMEYNLNRASGQFDGRDYTKYTRIIAPSWSGDPASLLDYMAAVEMAKYTGLLLVQLVKQLIHEKIQVNIIAHSLGNQVLLTIMEQLGMESQKEPEYYEGIEHVFMWEAAVPYDAFSSPAVNEDGDGAYKFPNAYKAAKRISVLYSQHDDVLGLLLHTHHEFWDKFKDPAGSAVIAGISEVISWIDNYNLPNHLKSVYNIANMLGVPFTFLLNSEKNRYAYYQSWVKKHPLDKHNNTMRPTLSDQDYFIRQAFPDAYNGLSLLIAAYQQGVSRLLGNLTKYMMEGWNTIPAGIAKLVWDVLSRRSLVVDQTANEMATLLVTVLISKNSEPRPAMGYKGPDIHKDAETMELYRSGKLILVDQTPWLLTHDGMKIPSHELMEHIYKVYIIGQKGMKKFGRHDCG